MRSKPFDFVNQRRVTNQMTGNRPMALPLSMNVNISSSTNLDKYPAKQHAARVANALDAKHGLIYLPGETTINYPDSDQPQPFRQLRYFLYLSGVDETDCHLTYEIDSDRLTIWLPAINPRTVVWVGRGSTTEEALEKYDVDDARYTPTLEHFLESWAINGKGKVYVLHPDTPVPKALSSWLNTKDLQPAIDRCRVIKDSHEIALIREANSISTLAHEAVLRNLLSFKNESQVEATFLDVSVTHGAKNQSYGIIAGSGPNAAILHYQANDADFGDSQLMCLDAGAEWKSYSSDVTRTFPLRGYWPTKESKEIYDVVQEMQTRCIENLKPGKHFVENQYLAHCVAIEGLLKLGILHNGTLKEIYEAGTSRAFFPHGLGHHVGLEVHDVSPPIPPSRKDSLESSVETCNIELHSYLPGISTGKHLAQVSSHLSDAEICRSPCQTSSQALEAGMIITVEPGIYFNKYALDSLYYPSPVHSKYINKEVVERYMGVGGVRIEDDILITPRGYEFVSTTAKGEQALKIIRGEA